MQRRFVIPIVVAAALAVIGAGAAYAYFFSSLRSAPSALTLSSPSPVQSAAPGASPVPSPLSSPGGTWQVAAGSLAGYRVSEQFVGQTAAHEAVARTAAVTGQLAVGAATLDSTTITVQLAGLQSTDTVAGYNVSNRDRIVTRTLDVSQFPAAAFTAGGVVLPAGYDSGQPVTLSLPGRLTIHGVTRSVVANVQVRVSGSSGQAAGSIAIQMTDYGLTPPSIGFTTVQPAVTIEFQLNLVRS